MGPSVKFVSAIKNAIVTKKMGVIFFRKKDHPLGGGVVRGRDGKRPYFSPFFAPFPYQEVDFADVDLPVVILERCGHIYQNLGSVEPDDF